MKLWLLVISCIVCLPYLAGDPDGCQCNSKCNPTIDVTSGGSGGGRYSKGDGRRDWRDRGDGRGRKCPDQGENNVAAADRQLWYCPPLFGSPCYHLRYPNLLIQNATWQNAYHYCKELGLTSNLTYYENDAEFDIVRNWLRTQFPPIQLNSLLWTSGVIAPIPIIPAQYYWNSTNRAITINRWQANAPRTHPCVGQNPNSDFELLDHDCASSVVPIYVGWICRRPPY